MERKGEGEGERGREGKMSDVIISDIVSYGSSGVNSVGSTTNCGSKFEGSLSESILGLYGGVN